MINLDMVGRLRENTLTAMGSDSAPEWAGEIERARKAAGLQVNFHGDGYGPSDQTSFFSSGVPVLFLFTGAHEQYHTPDDKADTLDPAATARVELFAMELTENLAREPVKLTYNRSTSSAPLMSGDSRGYGAYLGTIPDYRAMEATEGGVLLSDVRKDGPADRAGIRGKDRIVEMGGTRIENLYDMTYALQDHKPGETISVVVIRDGSPVTLRATLGDRSATARDTSGPAAMPGGNPPAGPGGKDKFDGLYAKTIKDDLKAVPTVSLVMARDDWFGSRGIYINESLDGSERVCSLEWIDPNGEEGFLTVNDHRDVEDPPGHQMREELRQPQHEPRALAHRPAIRAR